MTDKTRRGFLGGLARLVTGAVIAGISLEASAESYTAEDKKETARILYAESANQTDKNKRLVARTIINRAKSKDYPSTPYKVIHQKNAFTCTHDGSKLWKQANGKTKMNAYEEKVWAKSKTAAKAVYNGTKEGITREDEIVAYHDTSISKPNTKYWNSLELVYTSGKLKFYAPKKKK